MDSSDILLIKECEKYDIPFVKKNGDIYSKATLKNKLRNKKNMLGGADLDYNVNDDGNDNYARIKDEFGSVLSAGSPDQINKSFKNRINGTKKVTTNKVRNLEDVEDKNVEEDLVGYKKGRNGQAILEDSLLQAYFKRIGEKEITPDSEIPLSLAMAIYGNHAQLGKSGLSEHLPNLLENLELQEYFDKNGIKTVTPQTKIPVKYMFLEYKNH